MKTIALSLAVLAGLSGVALADAGRSDLRDLPTYTGKYAAVQSAASAPVSSALAVEGLSNFERLVLTSQSDDNERR